MTDWQLVRTKRDWVPEWLWRASGQVSVKRRWARALLTRAITPEEAVASWSDQGGQAP